MRPPTAILVDDEPQLVGYLKTALASAWPELEIVGEALDGIVAQELVEAHRPDIAFLDVQMPGRSGLEVARAIAGRCHVVFVTAYEQYAVQAFESAAVDYIVKPVEQDRLAMTVRRLMTRLATPSPGLDALVAALAERIHPPVVYRQWLQIEHRGDVVLLATEEVDLFLASAKYTLAVSGDREQVIRIPLKALEEQLDPARFWRVHRSAILRVGAIARVTHDERDRLIAHLRGSDRHVEISRAYAHLFRQA